MNKREISLIFVTIIISLLVSCTSNTITQDIDSLSDEELDLVMMPDEESALTGNAKLQEIAVAKLKDTEISNIKKMTKVQKAVATQTVPLRCIKEENKLSLVKNNPKWSRDFSLYTCKNDDSYRRECSPTQSQYITILDQACTLGCEQNTGKCQEYRDYTLRVGEKIPISSQMNLRIEQISDNPIDERDPFVRVSVWGRNNNNACKLMSSGREMWLNMEDYNYIEFVDSFIEIGEVNDHSVTLRRYINEAAYQRCSEVVRGNKARLACSFYETNPNIENGLFEVRYRGEEQQARATQFAQGFTNCYEKMQQRFENLNTVTPFAPHWRVIPLTPPGNAWSSDYERVSVPHEFDKPVLGPEYDFSVENGNCPLYYAGFTIPHELTHLLFSNTVLQGPYDLMAEFPYPAIGSDSMHEGMAQFMPYFIGKGQPDHQSVEQNAQTLCGRDRLNRQERNQEATEEQLIYQNILEGRGYQHNHYDAGFCFYYRIEQDCGEEAIVDLFNQVLEWDGSTQEHQTIFSVLANSCSEQTIREIMTDFGINHQLLEIQQRHPQNGFDSGLDELGCI
ncbi:hypothetical protein HYV86_02990 [Candidatus Woesearchaeota archaeon]|nr:hypothetical protein [Candidatus Woesearchaeota archaeon]